MPINNTIHYGDSAQHFAINKKVPFASEPAKLANSAHHSAAQDGNDLLARSKLAHQVAGPSDAQTPSRRDLTATRWDCAPFPTLPLAIEKPVIDTTFGCQIAAPSEYPLDELSTLIQGGWALTVSRMIDSEGVAFGITSSEIDSPVLSRIRVTVNKEVSAFLTEISSCTHETPHGVSHQDQNGSTTSAFNTLLVMRPANRSDAHKEDQTATPRGHLKSSPSDERALVLVFEPDASNINVVTHFDSRIIKSWVVKKLIERLEHVMHQMSTATSGTKLQDLQVSTPQDLEMIWGWNKSSHAPVERCIHDLIEDQVRVRKDAPAIYGWDGEFSYEELDLNATKLAKQLKLLGVGPETLVPLCFEKSVWMSVTIIAVLKAGGAFVLIDPYLPEERLKSIIQQTKADMILSSNLMHKISSRLVSNVITVNFDLLESLTPDDQILPPVSPSSAAYAVFTSGSTGTPKGVLVTHSNMASALTLQKEYLPLNEDTRLYDLISYSFGLAIMEFFVTLMVGGCLCVPSDGDRKNNLVGSFAELRSNTIVLTPSIAQLLSPRILPGLKTIGFGGEAVRVKDVMPWWGKVEVFSGYGSSECTTLNVLNTRAPTPEQASRLGVGAGLATWVVDPENHDVLVPPGCIGELVLEGPLVSRGYINNPQKTAEVFINDPKWLLQGHSTVPGRHGRLYKTGDLVRQHDDGSLDYIGRKDFQVKIRGQRVELGDVEHWIKASMPDVSQVAAEVIAPNGGASPALMAFLLLKDATPSSQADSSRPAQLYPVSEDVKIELAKHLPSYMIPTIFFSITKMPMTATGKTDRKQLRDMGSSFSVQDLLEMSPEAHRRTAPRSQVELQLQQIWARVLNLDLSNIGLEDSFVRLGGDSIAAMKVVGEAREIGIGLEVSDMFLYPNLESISRAAGSIDQSTEDIPPFSLLGESADVSSMLEDMSVSYSIDPSIIQDAYPCTPLQEGIMFLALKRPGDYIMQATVELSPDVDLERFCRAWESSFKALPILRTRLVQYSSYGLLQVTVDEDLQWIDATGLDNYLQTDRGQLMDLGEPLSRYALVKDDAGATRWFVWTIHHAIHDGWSMTLMLKTFKQFYDGLFVEDAPPFQGFIKRLQTQNKAEAMKYWKKNLENCHSEVFPLLPRGVEETTADQVLKRSLPRIQGKNAGVTESTMLRAAWALVAGQLTNSNDVVVGVTISGRNAPISGIAKVVGPTIATLPLRVNVEKGQDTLGFMQKIQQDAMEMIPYEQFGLSQIAASCPAAEQACRFQTLLVIHPPQDDEDIKGAFGELQLGSQEQWLNTYALMLEIYLKADEIVVKATFDSRTIDPWAADQSLQTFEQFFTKLHSAKAGQALANSIFLTPQDQQGDMKAIWGWNQHVTPSSDRTILDMLEDRVARQPQATAICAWDGELTYEQVYHLSNSLAAQLLKLDVELKIVPLCFEKSKWTTIAILAVLKAGSAFVLLDPTLPKQRLQTIVQQVGARLVVSSADCKPLATELCSQVFAVGERNFTNDDYNRSTQALPNLDLDSMAYLVFTSGSTGTPKGSIITHRSCATAISTQAKTLGYGSSSRVYDFSTYGFDLHIFELLHTLFVGGCLCVPSDHDRKNNLAGSINALKANAISITPSLARILLPEQVPKIKTMIFCAEALRIEDVEPWWAKVRLINGYGPSECTAFSLFNTDASTPSELTRLGKGSGQVTWVVDVEDHDRLAPLGCIGELVLEGPLVGPGYLNEPERSAAAYIQDPVWLATGGAGFGGRRGRLYKTGDLVKYNQDGSLTFVGRKDDQVKIRGQRVELSEVEHRVQEAMPEAAQVVAQVITPQGNSSIPELVVLLLQVGKTLKDENAGEIEAQVISVPVEVEDQLRRHLPTYMVPKTFFSMRKMPIGATGKLDRRRLREIASSFSSRQLAELRTAGQGSKQQPTSEAERWVQTIWSQILELDPSEIGIDDSFFQLGGNSIAAMKLVAEARKNGFLLDMADIFRSPRLHQVAKRAIRTREGPVAILKNQNTGPVQQSFAQGRLWFMEQLYPGLSWYLMPCAVRLRGPLNLNALKQALFALESRHETLRTTFESRNNVNLQVVQPVQSRDLNVIEVPVEQEQALMRTLEENAKTPFDLEREPGWRVKLYRIGGGDDHVLSIVMHHIISDGWSVDILQREAAAFYSAALRGKSPLSEIKPLPIQYQDYSVWQQEQTQVDEHDRQLDYWIKQLETAQPAELLLDKPRPATLSGNAGIKQFIIKGTLYERLQRFCQKYDTTPFVVLFAAFRTTHFRLTGQVDAVIGSPNANRDRWELRNIIGFFVNMQCLRTVIEDEEASFEQLVKQVQSVTLASFANQDVPFEKLVSRLRTSRDLSRNPLVQLVFAVHSQKDLGQFTFEGVESELIRSSPMTRFDLECHFFQQADSLRGEVYFSTDLFNPATIDSFLSIFRRVLEQGIEEPRTSVTSLSLMTDDDHRLLEAWGLNQVDQTDYPRESSVVDIFRQQVQACPSKVAVKDASMQLTYSELDQKSDDMAQWLAQRYSKPETPIGVYASRSCISIVAFLGILKANLSYLPLDTRMPVSRIETILSCLEGDKLVLLGSDLDAPNMDNSVEFVRIAQILDDKLRNPTGLMHITPPTATSLAYIMFTSGSTGQPKGVMIEHRGIVRLAKQSNIVRQIPQSPVMAHLSNTAFDGSTWEIYAALLNGGLLICIDSIAVLDSNVLSETFAREGVQTAFLTTALFKQYLYGCPEVITSLEAVCVGGERLDPRVLVAAHKMMKGNFIHVYGPTENTTFSTMYATAKDETYISEVPIGRTLSNSGAHVMDPHQNFVPVGVVGELVLTGDGLARGYTDPQRNINRFVTVNIGAGRVKAYRTGDYVRYRPVDGQLEFLGRMDGQIKIRGQRVELGEIEQAMRAHSNVKDAIAVVQQEGEQEPQLTGFVTLHTLDNIEKDDEPADATADNDTKKHVSAWEGHFEGDTYVSIDKISPESIGRDFVGWTSMYDGSDIDKTEMSEWLDDTIASIRNGGQPGHVLEIGSGTGMILFNLMEGLKSYVGLDPSASAVEFVSRTAKSIPELSDKVQMYKGTAADVGRLDRVMTPDLVVINSVAQYFPSQEYLLQMIKDVLQFGTVKTIYFGDMRSYAVHRQFLVARALRMLGEDLDKDLLRQKITELEEAELEFLVDPALFTSLPEMMPHLIDHVEIIPKRMKATNELSAYRYAAVVHTKTRVRRQQIHEVREEQWVDFQECKLDHGSVLRLLETSPRSSVVAISNIPYSKTSYDRHVLELIDTKDPSQVQPGDWLRSARRTAENSHSLAAIDLVELAQKAGCQVEISWARQHSQMGGLDAIFHYHQEASAKRTLFKFPTDHQGRKNSTLSSRPVEQQMKQQVRTQVLETLKSQLPSYMVPRVIAVLNSMPVNDNGKIDRRALSKRIPGPTVVRGASKRQVKSDTERRIQEIWAEVLNLERSTIGLDDGFFHLGGNSISAMRVVSMARSVGLQLSVADIFRHPTLEMTARAATPIFDECDVVAPFSLVPEPVDIDSLVEEISNEYGLKAKIEDVYPCTPLQEGLLALSSKRQGDYVMQTTIDLPQTSTVAEVKENWEELFRLVPILRTRIIQHDIGLVQVVCDEKINWIKARSLDEYLEFDRQLPMELGQNLTRFALVENEQSQVKWLVWTMHHALYDGWSLSLIKDAMNRIQEGKPIMQGPRFPTFIKYTREKDEDAINNYWRNSLGGYHGAAFPALPTHVEHPKSDTVIKSRLPKVQIPSSDLSVTESAIIRAAWALVTSRVTASDDVAFGVTVFGRNAPVANIELMMAPAFATVPVRIQVAKGQKTWDFLRAVHQQATDMIPYEQTGLQKIAKLSSDCRQVCNFQTLLVVQANTQMSSEVSDAQGQHEWFNPYAMMIEVEIGNDDPMARVCFDSRILEPAFVQNLLDQLGQLIQQFNASGRGDTIDNLQLSSAPSVKLDNETNGAKTDQLATERTFDGPSRDGVVSADSQTTSVQDGNGSLIFEMEQPSYALAEKIISMRPSWEWDGIVQTQSKAAGGKIGITDMVLHSSGLDSINMMSLMHFISRQFKVKVSLKFLIDPTTTIRKVARHIIELQSGTAPNGKSGSQGSANPAAKNFTTEIDRYDAKVLATQRLAATQLESSPRMRVNERSLTVFLTGANGFIGTQILRQLLEYSQVNRVIALVRGKTPEMARERAIEAATKALWWRPHHGEKLQVWAGDLSLPQLGLGQDHWNTLTDGETVDAIIHNGAVVHWGKSYDALEASNVSSSVDLLQIAVSSPATSFVYVTGGLEGLSPDEPEEETIKKISTHDTIGYSQTKFVAEAVVRRAAKRNQNPLSTISVLRPGLVVGTATEGVSNADDFLWRLAAACIRAGAYDGDGVGAWINVSDAATVAKNTIDSVLDPSVDQNTVVQVQEGLTSGEFWGIIAGLGYKLEPISTQNWLAIIHKDMELLKEKHPLWPVAHMFQHDGEQSPEQRHGRQRRNGETTPRRLREAVRKSAEFLASVGFFPLTGDETRGSASGGMTGAFSRSGLGLSG